MRRRFRSAIRGEFVTRDAALADPATTVAESGEPAVFTVIGPTMLEQGDLIEVHGGRVSVRMQSPHRPTRVTTPVIVAERP